MGNSQKRPRVTRGGLSMNSALLLHPRAVRVLVVPARRRAFDKALSERRTDVAFPLGFAVGARDLAIKRRAVLVSACDERVDLGALRERHGVGVAQSDVAVARQTDCAARIERQELRMPLLQAAP